MYFYREKNGFRHFVDTLWRDVVVPWDGDEFPVGRFTGVARSGSTPLQGTVKASEFVAVLVSPNQNVSCHRKPVRYEYVQQI